MALEDQAMARLQELVAALAGSDEYLVEPLLVIIVHFLVAFMADNHSLFDEPRDRLDSLRYPVADLELEVNRRWLSRRHVVTPPREPRASGRTEFPLR